MLKPEDYQFLRERRKLCRRWPLVGGGTMLFLLLAYALLAMNFPVIANPAFVYNALSRNELGIDVIQMLAMMAPVLFIALFIVLGVILSLGFAVMRKEKRLLDIIDRLTGNRPDEDYT